MSHFTKSSSSDTDTGMVTRNANMTLDRESVQSYFITVLATDKGNPPNNATATISITILVWTYVALVCWLTALPLSCRMKMMRSPCSFPLSTTSVSMRTSDPAC